MDYNTKFIVEANKEENTIKILHEDENWYCEKTLFVGGEKGEMSEDAFKRLVNYKTADEKKLLSYDCDFDGVMKKLMDKHLLNGFTERDLKKGIYSCFSYKHDEDNILAGALINLVCYSKEYFTNGNDRIVLTKMYRKID